jgi:hypothetical protein
MQGQGMGMMQGGMQPGMPPQQGMGGFPQQQVHFTHLQNICCLLHLHAHYHLIPVFFCRVSAMLVDFNARFNCCTGPLPPRQAPWLSHVFVSHTLFFLEFLFGVLNIPLQKVKDIVSAREVFIY